MTLDKTYQDFVAQARGIVEEIDVNQLKYALRSSSPPLLLDVREPEETCKGVIDGAMTIPRGVLERDIERAFAGRISPEDLDRPIVCYCSSGSRSLLACLTLKEMGFARPASLKGGYRAWIVSSC